jgi:hypothetical protein
MKEASPPAYPPKIDRERERESSAKALGRARRRGIGYLFDVGSEGGGDQASTCIAQEDAQAYAYKATKGEGRQRLLLLLLR